MSVRVYLCFVYFRKVNHFTVPFGTPGGMCVWFRPELTSSSASDRSSVFPCFRNNLQSVGGGLVVPRTWQFLFRSNVKIKLRNPFRECVWVYAGRIGPSSSFVRFKPNEVAWHSHVSMSNRPRKYFGFIPPSHVCVCVFYHVDDPSSNLSLLCWRAIEDELYTIAEHMAK